MTDRLVLADRGYPSVAYFEAVGAHGGAFIHTANAHMAEGLIWASLCAAVLKRFLAHAAQRVGRTALSTRRVAMCAHHILGAPVTAVLLGVSRGGTLQRGLTLLLANARRANRDRDGRIGRLPAGLGLVEAA